MASDAKPISIADYKALIKNMRILVVDDEPELREIIGDDFEMCGAKVMQAPSGNEAFRLFREAHAAKDPFRVIVTDIRMPQGDGVQLLTQVSAESASMAVNPPVFVMISGFSDYPSEEVLELGASALLAKPFQLQDLRNTVASKLQSR